MSPHPVAESRFAAGAFFFSGPASNMRTSFGKRLGGDEAVVAPVPAELGGTMLPPRGTSLAGNLFVLVAAVALPLIILGAGALWLQYRGARENAQAQLVDQARTTALLVDREFERTLAVTHTLAAAIPAAHGDLDALEYELRDARDRLLATLPVGTPRPVVTLIDANGNWLLHSEWPTGERRTGLQATPVGRAAVSEGQPQISDLFIGTHSHRPLVGLAVPVFAQTQDAAGRHDVIGAVGMSVPRERLIAIVKEVGLPPGAVASVLDRKGIIVARSAQDSESVGAAARPALLQAASQSPDGLASAKASTLGKSAPSTVAFARAPLTGYMLQIDVPEEVFLAPLRLSLFRSAMIGIPVFVAGLVLALFSARDIVSAFRCALDTAVAGAVPVPSTDKFTGLKEADELATLLATAIAGREQAMGNARALLDNSPIGIVIFDLEG
jgi:hypothetical protein